MPTVLLVRHGETDWNRSGQIMGERPVPLNANGREQVNQLAKFLTTRSVRGLYTSPVVRARQTAEILVAALDVPVTVDNGLTEVRVGQWEGLYWKDLAEETARLDFYAHPQVARPPGGETLHEVQRRATAAVAQACSDEGAGSLIVVSHADVVRAILGHYLHIDLQLARHMRIDHASLTALDLNGSEADLLFLNFTPSLKGIP
ncbi:MAG: histidine phosphatase family protein [Nitrospirae bacterium]|nr:histidine phosphatase family protein [Nitrospirota bacterium]